MKDILQQFNYSYYDVYSIQENKECYIVIYNEMNSCYVSWSIWFQENPKYFNNLINLESL